MSSRECVASVPPLPLVGSCPTCDRTDCLTHGQWARLGGCSPASPSCSSSPGRPPLQHVAATQRQSPRSCFPTSSRSSSHRRATCSGSTSPSRRCTTHPSVTPTCGESSHRTAPSSACANSPTITPASSPSHARSSDVVIRPEVTSVTVEGRDLVNGWGGPRWWRPSTADAAPARNV